MNDDIDMKELSGCCLSNYVIHRSDGSDAWFNHGKLHNADGPAVVTFDKQEWFYHGRRHNANGPAVIKANYSSWWYHGKRHRDNGPAVEESNSKQYYFHGLCHRMNGPAVINRNSCIYSYYGILHRIGGPAVKWSDGTVEYYIHGEKYTFKEYQLIESYYKLYQLIIQEIIFYS